MRSNPRHSGTRRALRLAVAALALAGFAALGCHHPPRPPFPWHHRDHDDRHDGHGKHRGEGHHKHRGEGHHKHDRHDY